MTIQSLDTALRRIATASIDSPIAIFKCDEPDMVDAVFASTVRSQVRIAHLDPRFIGAFHRDHNLTEVEIRIVLSLRERASLPLPPHVKKL